MIWIVLVAALASAGVIAADRAGAEPAKSLPPLVLPVTAAAETPVCPGPETLQAPDGAAAVPEPGPVAVAGLAVLPAAVAPAPASASAAGTSTSAAGTSTSAAGTSTSAADAGGLTVTLGVPQSGGASAGPGSATATAAGGRGALVGVDPTAAGPLMLRAVPGARVPAMGAAQWTLARSGDLRGLATASCGVAGTDTWLVGGGTVPGRRARLLLANPSTAPAVVDVTVYGPKGLVQAPAGTGVVVPPGGQKALFVDALAPGLTAIAVRVQARTGRIVALLHDSLLRGSTPGGTDDVQPAADPATRQVVPGIAVSTPAPGPGQSAGTLPSDPSAAGASAVRVAVPGSTAAVVRVHLLGPDGEVDLPGGGVATVDGRSVADIAVTGVPDGVYAAVIESDTPVVAGALVGRLSTSAQPEAGAQPPPAELAWAAAARAVSSPTVLALPALPSSAEKGGGNAVAVQLSLAAAGRAGSVEVSEIAADGTVGAPSTVAVPAAHAVTVGVGALAAGVMVRAGRAAGSVVAALVLTAADSSGELVSVQPVRPGEVAGRSAPAVLEDPRLGLAAAADPAAASAG